MIPIGIKPGMDHLQIKTIKQHRKIKTLEGMGNWDVVEHKDDMNAIRGTWAFKCKQYPNGVVI